MKPLYLSAYFAKNFGDDLFVDFILRRYPDVDFYIGCYREKFNSFRSYPNARCPGLFVRSANKLLTHYGKYAHVRLLHRLCSAVVIIGGSIFVDYPGWGRAWPDKDVKTFIIGANMEENISESFRQRVNGAVSAAQSCCFRDTYSRSRFPDFENVSYAPDVLFGYEPPMEKKPGSGIGISLICPEKRPKLKAFADSYYDAVAELCEVCRVNNVPVKLLGFCRKEGDAQAAEAVLDRLTDRSYPEVCIYDGDISEMLEQLSACSSLVGTRFHAMILGWVLGKNVVPVVYDTKQLHVLQDVAFRGKYWNMLAGEAMSGEKLYRAVSEDGGRLDISDIKERSAQQFAALDAFLASVKKDK